MNHSDAATAAAFSVEVKLSASAAAAPDDDGATVGQYDEPVSVVGSVLSTATATLSAAVDSGGTDGSPGKIIQLEEDVDKLMKKMGIHGMTALVSNSSYKPRQAFHRPYSCVHS